MNIIRLRDLVMIVKNTQGGVRKYAAVVTSIERIYDEQTGAVEHYIGYETVDLAYGPSGSGRLPRKGEYGIVDIKVVASGMRTRAERWTGMEASL